MVRRSGPHLYRECDEWFAGTNDIVQMAQTAQSGRALDSQAAVQCIRSQEDIVDLGNYHLNVHRAVNRNLLVNWFDGFNR